ncbi:MAG TPA: LysR family transcriptional regulator [Hyphomicrobiaceae bacterium]|nr:LysR family transcriptional regulator [Hyphomicrobiaceae bacterium]
MASLRSIDLNLLVVLDALLRERHVTRAARTVGLSQPAMSSALARRRVVFKAELLVRTATGMQPTPRAETLIEPVQQAIGQIERVLVYDQRFDAAHSERRFALRLSDLLSYLILPRLMALVAGAAPRITVDIKHLSPQQTIDALERDEIDAAVSMGLEHTGTINRRVLFRDRMVAVMRRAHPLARGSLTLKRFLATRHLKVSMAPSDIRFADDVLSKSNSERDVALNLPHWLLVPHILAVTDYVAVMPAAFATAAQQADLVVRELPFAAETFDWCLYWHRRHDADAANRWLRECIEAASAIDHSARRSRPRSAGAR